MELPAEAIDRLLDCWPVGRLATLGPGGRPHLVPIVFARVGDLLWSPIDAKPKRAREPARVRHVRANPAACLLLDHYDADWRRLWWLRLDARARVVEPRDPAAEAALAAAVSALRAKYTGYAGVAVLRDPPLALALETRSVASWCAGRSAIPVR